jgi:hypothetical protein
MFDTMGLLSATQKDSKFCINSEVQKIEEWNETPES